MFSFIFFFNSIFLGVGLAMDAFSVSLANGLNEPKMKSGKITGIAGIFAFFQALMPMLGWICVHTIISYFEQASKFIPYIALILLAYIGGKMIYEGKTKCCECGECAVGLGALVVQGIATSIDALSVGLDIAEYSFAQALVSALIIAIVTFIICMFGIYIGKKFGNRLSNKASIFGGSILVLIGIYIFIKGVFGA